MPSRATDRPDPRRPIVLPTHRRLAATLAATFAACTALAPWPACAGVGPAIYLIDDTPGEIHLSDRPDAASGATSTRLCGDEPAPSSDSHPRSRIGDRVTLFDDIVDAAARAQRIDPALLHAVIGVESGYLPRAVSPRGASGLMQLMPRTAIAYGVTDIFDPRQNVDAGAHHLRTLLDRYGQDVGRALAAYNAGAGTLARRAPLSVETAAYVPLVLDRYAAMHAAETGTARPASHRPPPRPATHTDPLP